FLFMLFEPILKLKKNWIPQRMEEELNIKLDKANLKITPIEFLLKKLVISIFVFLFALIYAWIFPQYKLIILTVGLIISALVFFYENVRLNSIIKSRELRLELELPELMIPLGFMLSKFSAFEATKRSIEYASDSIKPYAEELVAKLELEPGSHEPYIEFAKALNIPSAYQFMVALEQSMKMDEEKSKEIINAQIEVMQKLQSESHDKLVKMRPGLVSKYIIFAYLGMVILIMGISFVSIFDKFVNLF
ncbi:hypothetical protein P9W86_27330, partial [Bacillus cereus]|nr:hypothetical protein [Bacillus cereus]